MIEPLLTVHDVARILGIAPKTVNKLAREGELQYINVTGRGRRFTDEQVRKYIESKTTPPPIDVTGQRRIKCPQKGGNKSSGVGRHGLLREEIKELCR